MHGKLLSSTHTVSFCTYRTLSVLAKCGLLPSYVEVQENQSYAFSKILCDHITKDTPVPDTRTQTERKTSRYDTSFHRSKRVRKCQNEHQ